MPSFAAASRADRQRPRRRPAARAAALLATASLGLALTACAGSGEDAPSDPSAGTSASSGPLAQYASKAKDALERGVVDQDVTADAVRQALLKAGWSADDVEVSQNRTPTGLDVDKIEAGVRTQDGCVIAEVRPDHTVTVSTGAALSTGRCLAGHAYGQ